MGATVFLITRRISEVGRRVRRRAAETRLSVVVGFPAGFSQVIRKRNAFFSEASRVSAGK
jgi:hypothetical protein